MWLATLGLFFLTVSGVLGRSGILPIIAVALAAPFLLLRSPAASTTSSTGRQGAVVDEPDRTALGVGGIDHYRWENEGGHTTDAR
jgi:hypothetical protein